MGGLRAEQGGRTTVRNYFLASFERGRRVHGLLDDLVQTECVGPQLLVTKGIEAEDALAVGDGTR